MYNLSLIPATNSEVIASKTFKWIWNNAAPYRVQCFVSMVSLGKLKTGGSVHRVGILQQPTLSLCKFCGEAVESIDHSLLLCPFSWNVWCLTLQWWGLYRITPSSVVSLFYWWINFKVSHRVTWIWNCIPFAVLWSIWKLRNEHIFQEKALN